MSQGLQKLTRFLLHYAHQMHKGAEDLNKKARLLENSKEASHPMAKDKIHKMKHNAHLFMQASIQMRHAASELSRVKD